MWEKFDLATHDGLFMFIFDVFFTYFFCTHTLYTGIECFLKMLSYYLSYIQSCHWKRLYCSLCALLVIQCNCWNNNLMCLQSQINCMGNYGSVQSAHCTSFIGQSIWHTQIVFYGKPVPQCGFGLIYLKYICFDVSSYHQGAQNTKRRDIVDERNKLKRELERSLRESKASLR